MSLLFINCRCKTLQRSNITGVKHCRGQTLQGFNIAGVKHCRGQTLQGSNITVVKLCGIKLVELTNLTVEEYCTVYSVHHPFSNGVKLAKSKKIEKSLVVLTFALFIFSYFGSVWLYLLWACLVVLTFSLFGCTYSTLSLSNCT